MFMSMGMVLQIPLAAVADMVFHGEKTTAVLAAGYALIVAGFVLLAVEQRRLAGAGAGAGEKEAAPRESELVVRSSHGGKAPR